MSNQYQVELDNGVVLNVPKDKARSRYECISDYGMQAVLERARRTRVMRADPELRVRTIICPSGDEITQF